MLSSQESETDNLFYCCNISETATRRREKNLWASRIARAQARVGAQYDEPAGKILRTERATRRKSKYFMKLWRRHEEEKLSKRREEEEEGTTIQTKRGEEEKRRGTTICYPASSFAFLDSGEKNLRRL